MDWWRCAVKLEHCNSRLLYPTTCNSQLGMADRSVWRAWRWYVNTTLLLLVLLVYLFIYLFRRGGGGIYISFLVFFFFFCERSAVFIWTIRFFNRGSICADTSQTGVYCICCTLTWACIIRWSRSYWIDGKELNRLLWTKPIIADRIRRKTGGEKNRKEMKERIRKSCLEIWFESRFLVMVAVGEIFSI